MSAADAFSSAIHYFEIHSTNQFFDLLTNFIYIGLFILSVAILFGRSAAVKLLQISIVVYVAILVNQWKSNGYPLGPLKDKFPADVFPVQSPTKPPLDPTIAVLGQRFVWRTLGWRE